MRDGDVTTLEATEEQIQRLTALRDKAIQDGSRVINISGLSKEDWLILRSIAGVGASESSTAAGKNPWQTPLSAWKEKVGHIIQLKDSPRLRIGNYVESGIVTEYEYLTGIKVQNVKDFMFLHPELDYLFANLDGIIPPTAGDPYGILEAKSTNSYVYDTWLLKLPTYYFRQAMAEIAVLDGHPFIGGAEVGFVDFATMILDRQVVEILRINKDGEFIKQQTIELGKFWYDNVLANIPPDPNAAEYAVTEPMQDSFINADTSTYEKLTEVIKLDQEIGTLKDKREELADEVKEVIGDHESLIYEGEVIATWKAQQRTTIDSKKLKKEQPEIAEQYSKKSMVRVFRPKEIEVLSY